MPTNQTERNLLRNRDQEMFRKSMCSLQVGCKSSIKNLVQILCKDSAPSMALEMNQTDFSSWRKVSPKDRSSTWVHSDTTFTHKLSLTSSRRTLSKQELQQLTLLVWQNGTSQTEELKNTISMSPLRLVQFIIKTYEYKILLKGFRGFCL